MPQQPSYEKTGMAGMSLFVRRVRTMSKINSYVSQASAALFHIWQIKSLRAASKLAKLLVPP